MEIFIDGVLFGCCVDEEKKLQEGRREISLPEEEAHFSQTLQLSEWFEQLFGFQEAEGSSEETSSNFLIYFELN